MTIVSVAPDSSQPIAQAVRNSNVDPIAASFDIKAYGKDSNSVVIDVTDFFKLDNQPVSLGPDVKRRYNLGGIASDRSFISYIHSYPLNTEVRTIKTFNSSARTVRHGFGNSTSLPAADVAGVVTMELNNSFIMLPAIPMRKRLFDPRVGYFASEYSVYTEASQKTKTSTFIQSLATRTKGRRSGALEEGRTRGTQKTHHLLYRSGNTKTMAALPDCRHQRLAGCI